ncbi:pickpocket protein 28-like [Uranotaenia lowii]|uniref:pickpocket protein 28-like n=1 Tax=Uranotaenia lowii TaxID=190385 RepID=UPI00247ACFE4|nr:pickpocket protein 28-like [Uranotaenia lowii]
MSRILTDDGICYNFNLLDFKELFRKEQLSDAYRFMEWNNPKSEWNREEGYDSDRLESYPRRISGSGTKFNLYLLLQRNRTDEAAMCQGTRNGFKVAFHLADELPVVHEQFNRVSLNQIVSLAITPQLSHSTPKLKEFSSRQRRCFYNSERYLRFFRVYNLNNCLIECLVNATFKRCGCSPFFLPHGPEMPACNFSQQGCYKRVAEGAYTSQESTRSCRCVPACAGVDYKVEQNQVPTSHRFNAFAKKWHFQNQSSFSYDTTILSISLKARNVVVNIQRERLSKEDIVGKFGGLFALFLGASLMTGVEIFYYCLIRPLRIFFGTNPTGVPIRMVQPISN